MEDQQCGFRRKSSSIDHIFYIRQIIEKNWEYNEPVYQILIDFKMLTIQLQGRIYIRFPLCLVSLGNL